MHMENPLVTVVVPVYKVEQYLDRCIESIVSQTYRNLEILLVDDGSPDRCPQLCDEWAKKDSRIRVIHQENRGLGMARNTGIEQAKGRYLCFFDSDDYVAQHAVEEACTWAQREGADIVLYGMNSMDGHGHVAEKELSTAAPKTYEGKDVQEILLPDLLCQSGLCADIPMSAWSALFSAELIRRADWRFVSEREVISEDIYSILALYAQVQKAVVLQQALYFYCENESSLSRTYRPDRYERNRFFYIQCLKRCKAYGYSDVVFRSCAEPFLRNTIGAMKQEAACHDRKTAIRHLREIMEDSLLQQVLDQKRQDKTNLKKRMLFWTIRNHCYLLCYILLTAKNAAKK